MLTMNQSKRESMAALVAKWEARGLSQTAFCQQESIHLNVSNPEVWMEYVLRKINSTPESEYEKLLPIKENFPEGKIS